MELYRFRIVRFTLGIAVVIAVIQILTTLHFSSIHSGGTGNLLRAKTKRGELHSTLGVEDQWSGAISRRGDTNDPQKRVSRTVVVVVFRS